MSGVCVHSFVAYVMMRGCCAPGLHTSTHTGHTKTINRFPADIENHVTFSEGEEGLTKVTLAHSGGSKVEIHLFGGCITSWTQPSKDEILFIRPDAKFDGSKPISGGIPHCFPQVCAHA